VTYDARHGGTPRTTCPDTKKLHSKEPSGYLQWHEWAEKKAKTHEQTRCPTCGYWVVWVLRYGTPEPTNG